MFNFLVSFIDKIADLTAKYIGEFISFFLSLPWYIQLVSLLIVAILSLIGFIRLIVKSWKVIIVLAVIGGIGFAVYYFVLKKDEPKETVEAISTSMMLLKAIF